MKKKIIFIGLICLAFLCCKDILDNPSANCIIVGSITVQEDFENDIKFLGEIRNDGDGKALFVKIDFTMKNASGSVIGTSFTYVNSTDLNPGQTSSFDCWTKTPYAQVDSWTHEITWDEEN